MWLQIPSAVVVAVACFSDAAANVEPVVRKATKALHQAACQRRDGLDTSGKNDLLQFCQYDAIFSMDKCRGEVWLHHPWSTIS